MTDGYCLRCRWTTNVATASADELTWCRQRYRRRRRVQFLRVGAAHILAVYVRIERKRDAGVRSRVQSDSCGTVILRSENGQVVRGIDGSTVARAAGGGSAGRGDRRQAGNSLARRPSGRGMMVAVELDLDLVADDLRLRALVPSDAALVVEATRHESAPALWGPRPAGPYTIEQAAAALAAWSPEHAQISYGMMRNDALLAAIGLMLDGPEGPGSAELAYWVRPEQRRQGLASRGVQLVTDSAHRAGLGRIWLEINPTNVASLRLAERCGYQFEQRLPGHCRSWVREDEADDPRHDCLIWSHTVEAG